MKVVKRFSHIGRAISALLCVCLLACALSLTACSRAPKVEDIYDRVVELIEASNELNVVFYGAGLPVYAADSLYADFTHLYHGFSQTASYEYVTEHAKFLTEGEIKAAAEQVYSKDYLENVLYPAAFVGYAIDDGMGSASFAHARYYDDGEHFCRSAHDENYLKGIRIYDYSTMRVTKPSDSSACYVTLDSWLESDPNTVIPVRLRLVSQNNIWYLDSFSG